MPIDAQYNFIGGINKDALEASADESTILTNFDHTRGKLKSVFSYEDIDFVDDSMMPGESGFLSHDTYTDRNGKSWLMMRSNSTVWLGKLSGLSARSILDNSPIAMWYNTDVSTIEPNQITASPDYKLTCTACGRVTVGATYARYFNGSTSIALSSLASSDTFVDDAKSVVMWIKGNRSMSGDTLIYCHQKIDDGLLMYADRTGNLHAVVISDAADMAHEKRSVVNYNVMDGNWHLLSVTYAGSANDYPLVYIDGVLKSSTAYNATNPYNTIPTSYSAFKGLVGMLSVHSAILSETDINSYYVAESGLYTNIAKKSVELLPLLANVEKRNAADNGFDNYITARMHECRESFTQIGEYAYISTDTPAATDYVYRWDGYCRTIGQAKVSTLGKVEFDATGALSATPDVRPGDIIYFKDAATWHGTGFLIEAVHPGDGSTDNGNLYTCEFGHTGGDDYRTPNSDFTDYCIVRLHRIGIPKPAAPTYGVDSATGYTGTARHSVVYKNTYTGYESVPSDYSSSHTVADKTMNLVAGAADTLHQQWDITHALIYRQEYAGSPANWGTEQLVEEINLIDSAATIDGKTCIARKAFTYADDAASGSLTEALPDAATYRNQPGALAFGKHYNNRLFAFGHDDTANYLWLSSMFEYEYFPIFDATSVIPTGSTYGGYWIVTPTSFEMLTGMVPEGGAWDTSGTAGTSLLVFSNKRRFRFFGDTWDDFSMLEAGQEGCDVPRTLTNVNGMICWMWQNNIIAMPSGGREPKTISDRLWRNTISATDDAEVRSWAAYPWKRWYLLCAPTSAHQVVYGFDMQSGTWTSFDGIFVDLMAWRPYPTSQQLLSGLHQATVDSPSRLANMLSGTSSVVTWRSRALCVGSLDGNEPSLCLDKKLEQIIIQFVAPESGAQDITINIYAEGRTTNPLATVDITVSASADSSRYIYKWNPACAPAMWYQVEVTGTITSGIGIDWIMCRYLAHTS